MGPMCSIFLCNYEFSKRAYVYIMNGGFDKDLETVPCVLASSLLSGVLAIYLTQPLGMNLYTFSPIVQMEIVDFCDLDTLRCRIQTRYSIIAAHAIGFFLLIGLVFGH